MGKVGKFRCAGGGSICIALDEIKPIVIFKFLIIYDISVNCLENYDSLASSK